MNETIRFHLLSASVLLVSSALLLGCSSKTPAPGAAPTAAQSGAPPFAQGDSENFDTDDPCSLLEPKEVEAVLGAPLGTPPFRARGPYEPAVDGDQCVYKTADFHYITLSVTFTGGAQAFSMVNMSKKLVGGAADPSLNKAIKQSFKLDDGTELTGEWDEASLMPMNCCIFEALRADQLIEIDFTGSSATLRQAASLIDAAYKRIDTPLKIDGGANVAAAAELEKRRVQPVNPCSLLSRAEVEAVIGKLIADPVAQGKDSCSYEVPPAGIRQVYELHFTWRNGYYDWRQNGHVAKIAGGTIAKMSGDVVEKMLQHELGAQGAAEARPASEAEVNAIIGGHEVAANDAWERAADQGMGFAAVKKDVLVTIDLRGVKEAAARALVAAVMRKI
jgi:hypothetical protein